MVILHKGKIKSIYNTLIQLGGVYQMLENSITRPANNSSLSDSLSQSSKPFCESAEFFDIVISIMNVIQRLLAYFYEKIRLKKTLNPFWNTPGILLKHLHNPLETCKKSWYSFLSSQNLFLNAFFMKELGDSRKHFYWAVIFIEISLRNRCEIQKMKICSGSNHSHCNTLILVNICNKSVLIFLLIINSRQKCLNFAK